MNVRLFFNPLDRNSVVNYDVPVGTPLIDFLVEHYPTGFEGVLHVLVGTEPLAIEDLDYRIKEHDRVTMLVLPSIEAATLGTIILSALVSAAIGFVINLIFKPSTPGISNQGEESPIYSLSPTRNAARLGEPISVHYGTVSFPPDFAAAPYQFFWQASNDQYVDELLCLGMGEYDVEQIFIGDTPIDTMEPGTVRHWLFGPADHRQRFGVIPWKIWQQVNVTDVPWRFRENVFTSPEVEAFEFNGDQTEATTVWAPISGSVYAANVDPLTGSYILGRIEGVDSSITVIGGDTFSLQNTTSNNTSFIVGSVVIDPDDPLLMTIFEAPNQPSILVDEIPLNAAAEYQVNTVVSNLVAGPFRAQKPGQLIDHIDCDIVFQQGLYRIDGNDGSIKTADMSLQFDFQQINPDTGAPIGVPVTVNKSWTEKRRVPVRTTVRSGEGRSSLPVGAYEVTVTRTEPVNDDSRKIQTPTWVGLKSQVVNDENQTAYGPVTLLALRMKATNGLGSAARTRVRVKARRLLGDNKRSENPVTIIKDIWTNSDYGMNRPLAELDTATLDPLETEWDLNEAPNFNGGFDQRATGLEAMQSVMSLAAGKVVQDGGLTTVVLDKLQTVRTAMFSSGNMIQDSLQIIYTFDTDGDYDGVIIEYRDPETFDAAYITHPADAINPEAFFLYGCTDPVYAGQYAVYLWQVKARRRKLIRFNTELEGLLPKFGDRIAVAHPLPQWAESGVVVEKIDSRTFRVDKFLDWTTKNVAIFRTDVGAPGTDIYNVTRGSGDNIMVLDRNPTTNIHGPEGIDPTSYAFGTSRDLVRDFMLTKITPKGETQIEVEAQTYDEIIYNGAPPHLGVVPEPKCIQWGVSQTQVVGKEIWRSDDLYDDASKDAPVLRLLRHDGLMACIGDQLYQVEAQTGDIYGKNRLWYSSDFGENWVTVDRPYDDWTASWWGGTYPGLVNNGCWLNLRKRIGGGLFTNYFFDDSRQFHVATVSGSASNIFYSSFDNPSRLEYTAAKVKIVSHCYYIDVEGPGVRMGGKTGDAGAFNVVLNLSGREDGEDPVNDGFLPEPPPSGAGTPQLLNDDLIPSPPPTNCYVLKEVGGWTFMCGDFDAIWIYDPNFKASGIDIKEIRQSNWNGVSFWFAVYENDWLYENQGPMVPQNAILDTSDRNPWGWVKFQGYFANQPELIVPYGGVATGGNPNAGKFRYYRITGQTPGSALSEGDYEYLPLLQKQVGSETSLEVCRLWYIEEISQFVLVYAFNQNATSDGWPQRFYMRMASDPDPNSFGDPLRVDHPPESFGGNQISARGNGAYAIDYSTTRNKFIVSSRHQTASGVYHQILWEFDNVYVCELYA